MNEDALFAADKGDVEALRALADAGVDLDQSEEGWLGPPIVLAVNGGHEDAARFLLERGVAIPPTLLATACYTHRLRRRRRPGHFVWLIRELIEKRDVDPNYSAEDNPPALCMTDDVEIARLLIEHGADVTLADDVGDTPLHNAARMGASDLAALFIEHGADPNARNDDGETPLDIAREDADAPLIAALGG